MPVYLSNATRGMGIAPAPLRACVERLLAALDESAASVSVSLVRDRAIRRLNRDYRGRDAPTDVLSFSLVEGGAPAGGERMLGDIVISVDTALRQAADYGASLEDELRRLLIHGMLHLLGHDHEIAAQARTMRAEERRLARAIGLTWPY